MRIKDLKEELKNYPDNVEVSFKLVPNSGISEDTDELDEPIKWLGEIYTGGLDDEEPFLEIGLEFINKKL